MNYSEFLIDVGELTAMGADDADLLVIIPATIEYVEGRIYNDPFFDFLSTRQASTVACTIGTRTVTKPAALISVDSVNLITPAGAVPDAVGSSRVPLEPRSLPYIDAVWSGASGVTGATGQPKDYAPFTDAAFKLGPVPAAAYVLEFLGPTRPAALSEANPTTFITVNMPELFLAGAMVFLSGWMKNFSAASDNPEMPVNWEQQFNVLKIGPQVVEARRKFASVGWTSQPPTLVAQPPRS